MHIVALAAALAFRVIAVAVLAAGTAALVAAAVSLPLAGRLQWAASIPSRAAAIGTIFVGATIGSFVTMPRQSALIRRLPPTPDRIPAPVLIIAVGSCLAVALQVPSLVEWWSANRAGIDAMVGIEPDPHGFKLVPAVIVQSSAALAAAALLSFAVAAVLVLSVPARVVFRVLASCVLVQGALVVGEYLVREEIDTLGNSLRSLLEDQSVEAASLSAWLAANGGAARAFEIRLVSILGVWIVAAVLGTLATRRTALTTAAPAAASYAPEVSPSFTLPSAATAPGPSLSRPPSPAASLSGSPFDQSNYSVRPRVSLNPFARRYSEYDIESIPPMSSARFSFSWTTGRLTHARDGRLLLAVEPAEAPGLFFDKSYVVTDGPSGVALGALVPSGADWTMKDASGVREVYVLSDQSRVAFARFVASNGDRELCRFTWTIEKTVLSAGIEIEFSPDADPALRSLAMALAPILEIRSRLRSERYNT